MSGSGGDHDAKFLAGLLAGGAAMPLDRLIARVWPTGAADRTHPAATQWVRRWGPHRIAATPLPCACATGRCEVCN